MIPSTACIALTKRFEGCRLSAYQDENGVLTIGWGHTEGVQPGDTCTQDEADGWLMHELQAASVTVARHVDVAINQPQFDALTDFCYNVGYGDFTGSTLLRLLNAANYAGAAEQFLQWDRPSGILDRRKAERTLFLGEAM